MINNIDDIKYLCTNLGNLSGIPVRLFYKDKEVFYYSLIKLLKDPFIMDKDQVFKSKEEVSYYQNPYFYYYGIINHKDYKIVVGPTRQMQINDQELKSIAFTIKVSPSAYDEFISEMNSLVSLPLMSLLQIMCMVYFAISNKKKSLENITIHESTQQEIQEEIEKEDVKRTMDNLEGYSNGPYNALDLENRIMDMVMRGDVSALNEFMSHIPAIRSGKIANEELRQQKNLFIVTATLVARAAIRGGMDVTSSLALSDAYIQKCELANNIETTTELNYRLVLDYAERVQKLRIGNTSSVLVNKVSNYIQQHLSEPIKVNNIAKALYMGRSRLSTNFKNETGINLSDYITDQKIAEAKRLLRYSNKSFIDISIYLGFSSQSHFSKVFKEKTETTPFEYRQMHKHY